MAFTQLDPKTALVLIDLQKMIVNRPNLGPYSAAEIIKNCNLLITAFRKKQLPIVLVNVIPADRPAHWRSEVKMTVGVFQPEWAEIVPEIEVHSTDILITKNTWSAFYNTPLHEQLQQLGVTGIVLGGIATSIGVEATARAAYERMYNVSFAMDAMTDLNGPSHAHSQAYIFPRIGEVGNTQDIINLL